MDYTAENHRGAIYDVGRRACELLGDETGDVLVDAHAAALPVAADIRNRLERQPPRAPLFVDFTRVRVVTLSAAERLGPLLMKLVALSAGLKHRYPVFLFSGPEPLYTFARAFADARQLACVLIAGESEACSFIRTVSTDALAGAAGEARPAIVGEISDQMLQVLALADRLALAGLSLTSDGLATLNFPCGSAARSKRLTTLYDCRLLAFVTNPLNHRQRLFTPVWRLAGSKAPHSITPQVDTNHGDVL